MSTYSAFFSSGLLAPPSLYPKTHRTPPSSPVVLTLDRSLVSPSPSPVHGSSSPVPVPYDMDMEDADVTMDDGDGDAETTDAQSRSPTPTPSSVGARSRSGSVTSAVHNHNHHHQRQHSQSQTHQRKTLRRRKSSLTVGTSPMNAIKSPQRNAGNALHLQQKLPPPPPLLPSMGGSIGRARSGSLNLLGFGFGGSGNVNESSEPVAQTCTTKEISVASQATSLIGRMRSGSIGGSTFGNLFRPRRNVRRLASLPAPIAPPPSLPLPAVPGSDAPQTPRHTKSYSLFHNTSIFSNPRSIFSQVADTRRPLAQHIATNSDVSSLPSNHASDMKRGRGRAFSCTAGVAVDSRIDEETMKED